MFSYISVKLVIFLMIQPVNIINIYKLMLVHESTVIYKLMLMHERTVICALVHLP